MCVCVRVRAREREKERRPKGEREKKVRGASRRRHATPVVRDPLPTLKKHTHHDALAATAPRRAPPVPLIQSTTVCMHSVSGPGASVEPSSPMIAANTRHLPARLQKPGAVVRWPYEVRSESWKQGPE
jgi:hypothetical protein